MVAGAGMKLTCLNTVGLTVGKFSDGCWCCNDADSLDALALTGSKSSDNDNS